MPTSKTIAIFSGLALAAFCAVRLMPAQSPNFAVQIPATAGPNAAPQFSVFEFGFAELDPAEVSRVLFQRAAFKSTQRMRTEILTKYQNETRTRTVTDSNGRQREEAYVVQVPYQETREVAYTHNEPIGTQTLTCPLESLTVVNLLGKQLPPDQVRSALSRKCRVIIQMVGSTSDAYYNSFLHPDTLFFQSDKWVDAALASSKREQDRETAVGSNTQPKRSPEVSPPGESSRQSREEGLESISKGLKDIQKRLEAGNK